MLQNCGNVGGAESKKPFFKKLSLLYYVCLCSMHFLPFIFSLFEAFFVQFFLSNSYGCLLSTHELFLPLKSGSKVKISQNSELSRLPKIKKISPSMVRIFHISTESTSFFRMERSSLKSPTTLPSWIFKF